MIDIKELKEQKIKNFEERLKFIDLWCDYIKKTPNKVWSSQQAEIINSQITKDMI
ncbi:MAG: hypothetical protein KQA41_00595 [Candidatus Aenigmarchaeota archaeon]|nr:hypothetical protein [Candidatus Aenigmarchaeota archaeon]MBU5688716.1 hypothetical protein [Candidatus Aenigmarchaeota archaeon]